MLAVRVGGPTPLVYGAVRREKHSGNFSVQSVPMRILVQAEPQAPGSRARQIPRRQYSLCSSRFLDMRPVSPTTGPLPRGVHGMLRMSGAVATPCIVAADGVQCE
jgi:hypothetical protein